MLNTLYTCARPMEAWQVGRKEDIHVRSCLDEKVKISRTSNFGVISWTSWSALTYSFFLSLGLSFRNSLDQGSSRFHKQCGKKALLLTVAVPARDLMSQGH